MRCWQLEEVSRPAPALELAVSSDFVSLERQENGGRASNKAQFDRQLFD